MKVLISMVQLGIGGTERALMGLLKAFDRPGVDVTLLLEDLNVHCWKDQIPNNVQIKQFYSKFMLGNAFLSVVQPYPSAVRRYLLNKLRKLLTLLLGHLHISFASRYCFALKFFEQDVTEYDLALDYYGYGNFETAYIAQKVKAKKKATWLHSITLTGCNRTAPFYPEYDAIYCVSSAVKKMFDSTYPAYKDKSEVLYNYIDVEKLQKSASCPVDDERVCGDGILVSVGRLAPEKGYDISIQTAAILKKRGILFHWFIIGEGPERTALQKLIEDNQLTDSVFLMGAKSNPMPYVKAASLYVQTSRNEGFGLTVAEALALGKKVVASSIESFREQIEEGVNGFLVENTPEFMANSIGQLLTGEKELHDAPCELKYETLESMFQKICSR